jgi:hypothetical protein
MTPIIQRFKLPDIWTNIKKEIESFRLAGKMLRGKISVEEYVERSFTPHELEITKSKEFNDWLTEREKLKNA